MRQCALPALSSPGGAGNRMTRASILAIALLASTGANANQACAQPTATLPTEARLIEPAAGIDIVGALVLPSISLRGFSGLASSIPSATISSITPSGDGQVTTTTAERRSDNTSLRIQRQSNQAVSMAVPESFQVIRSGGSQALTVRTLTQGGYNLGDGVLLGSGASPQTLSINVGGALNAFDLGLVEPGLFSGVLSVMMSYN